MTQCVETRGPMLRGGWRAFWTSASDLGKRSSGGRPIFPAADGPSRPPITVDSAAAHFSYYNMLRWMEVHDSARKHGIADADIAHAITHHLYAGDVAENEGPPWRVLYLGPDRAGNLLEVWRSNATTARNWRSTRCGCASATSRSYPEVRNTMMTEHRGTSGGVKLTREQLDALVEEADHVRRVRGECPAGGARFDAAADPGRRHGHSHWHPRAVRCGPVVGAL
jgi:GNAT superfamily N-acetyltransferase